MVKASYYAADDVKKPFKRASKAPKLTKLKPKVVPGAVLILLTGRFKGRRVVFLKQLGSGLLLVTGPYKINGVPLKRVNQAYVLPTSTKVDLAGLDLAKVTDNDFVKPKAKKTKDAENQFFEKTAEPTAEDKQKLQTKKTGQTSFDKSLVDAIKKVEHLSAYLNSRFTIRKNTRPHELLF